MRAALPGSGQASREIPVGHPRIRRPESQALMTSGPLPESYFRDFLVANQNSDGGWGFHPASPSAVEPTAWSLMALVGPRRTAAPAKVCDRAREWLLQAQLPDGSWPAIPGQQQGCWVTSVAAHALQLQAEAPHAVGRGRDWLLHTWPAEGSVWWRLRQAVFPSRIARQNTSLRGWSWTVGTASWVEPTAHALNFLRTQPDATLPPLAAKRRKLAERMLFDRMCPGGGWNSGNPLVYGVGGLPRIGPTAWALLALRGLPACSEISLSLAWLERAATDIRGAASLALAHRCLVACGRQTAPLVPALAEMHSLNHFFDSVLTIAWAALALNEEQNGAELPPVEAANR